MVLVPGLLACPNPVRQYTADSEFIFRGTHLVLDASTIDAEEVSGLAIVRVDEVLSGAPVFRGLAGQQVTVRLSEPGRARVGQERVFFTRSWHFGESIGVIEVGSVEAPDARGLERMQDDIRQAQQAQSDAELTELLQSAELVMRGRVERVRPADVPPMASEHDPMWHEADVTIVRLLKGEFQESTITIWFPMSDDVMWRLAPRFEPNVEGIWLLKTVQFAGRPLERLTALTPQEFRVPAEEDRVTRLLRRR
jgi:hypothetical protein